MRKCLDCDYVGEPESFPLRGKSKYGKVRYDGRCGPCKNTVQRDRYTRETREQKDNRNARARKRRPFGVRHGLTYEERENLKAKQNYKCAVCGNPEVTHLDHDHGHCSGQQGCKLCVRGYLCTKCNMNMGFIETDNYHKMMEYLLRYGSTFLYSTEYGEKL